MVLLRGILLCLLAIRCCPAHPIAELGIEIVREDGAVVVLAATDLEAVVSLLGIPPDRLHRYSRKTLRDAIRRFGDELTVRLRLLDGDGEALDLAFVEHRVVGVLPEEADFEELLAIPVTWRLRGAWAEPLADLSGLVDFGAASRAINLTVVVELPGTGHPRQLWAEGTPYPVVPDPDTLDPLGYTAPHPALSAGVAYLTRGAGRIRFEVLIPYLAIADRLPVARADPAVLAADERAAVAAAMAEWLRASVRLELDGRAVPARFVGAECFPLGSDEVRTGDAVPVLTTRIGATLELPLVGADDELALVWEGWAPDLRELTVHALLDGDERETVVLAPLDARASWALPGGAGVAPGTLASVAPPRPPTRIPVAAMFLLAVAIAALWAGPRRGAMVAVLAALCALTAWRTGIGTIERRGDAAPDEDRARAIVAALQRECYRAYAYADPAALWDCLDAGLAEPARTELFLDFHRRLAGGEDAALVDVDASEVDAVAVEGPLPERPGFRARCTWTVTGFLLHWGHRHARRVRVDALLDVVATDAGWRIADLHVTDKRRL